MIKKHILCGALALSMLIPMGVSAQALTTTTKPDTQVVATKKNSAKAPYASKLKLERQTIKDNYNTNKTIKDGIKGKLVQVKTLIKQNKTNKTLKSKKDALKNERATIKSNRVKIKAINVTLIADRKIVKTDVTNKNYAALVNDLNNISLLQKSKTPILKNISSDLDSLISALK